MEMSATPPAGPDAPRPDGRVSATVPDWSRERPQGWWDPTRRLVRAIRSYQGARSGPLGAVTRKVAVARHRFWSVVTQVELHLTTRIGGGLVLKHGSGTVVHPDVRMGPNCMIFQNVTLGAYSTGRPGVPVLGGHVDVGAGAKVLGPVSIGDHAVIGANAVVLQDVPAGMVAVGVPAKILTPTKELTA